MPNVKPLLLIDVDGPLIPDLDLRLRSRHLEAGWIFDTITDTAGSLVDVRLHPEHERMLRSLEDLFELTWATTWGEEANEHIGPRIGLPTLPVLPLDPERYPITPVLSWKTDQIAELLAGRPFAWIDDEVSQHDRRRLAGDLRVGPHLARRIPAWKGLRAEDVDALRAWAVRR